MTPLTDCYTSEVHRMQKHVRRAANPGKLKLISTELHAQCLQVLDMLQNSLAR